MLLHCPYCIDEVDVNISVHTYIHVCEKCTLCSDLRSEDKYNEDHSYWRTDYWLGKLSREWILSKYSIFDYLK